LVFFNRRLFATFACGTQDVSDFWNIEGNALTLFIAHGAAMTGRCASHNHADWACLPWRPIGAWCG
jgi:hypothetical protein